MQINKPALWSLAALALLLSSAWALSHFTSARGATGQASTGEVIYLDQGWSKEVREGYYHLSQGSTVMPYDIFLNLEVAGGQELFRSDSNSEQYGFTPDPADPRTNPDGLPVGLSKTVTTEGPWKGEEVGLTCAACHNTELHYQGKRIRIDGGVGNHFDIEAYLSALDDATQETLKDSAKFDRLASRVGASSSDAKSDLRKRFEGAADRVHNYRTRVLVTPYQWGPSRMDAISLIVNRVTSIGPDIPQNWAPPLAPTKPPFLWNAPQGSWTQWRGVQQDPIDRNLTETMGVYMHMNLTAKSPEEGLYDSNARLNNLEEIEDWINHLAPPKWPEEVFGKIDRVKAAQGKKLFASHCAECHNSYPYTWTEPNKYGKRFLEVGLIPQKYVGTDRMQFEDIRPLVMTGQLAPYLPGPLKDKVLVPQGYLYYGLSESILHVALAKINQTPEEAVKMHGYRELPVPRPSEVPRYKAAPREGVWATPPYMHNGSVPNLYEMLVPADQRMKKFYLGREFDPVKVGVDTSGNSGTYMVDTALVGSSNSGHSFENAPLGNGVIGPLLTDEERWALVEYLKSIPENAGQVTPFGGPPNAVTGHAKWAQQPEAPPKIGRRLSQQLGHRRIGMSDHVDGPRQIGDPPADLTDLFAFTSPENAAHTVVAANVFPSAGVTAMFSNAIDHSIVIRRMTVAGVGNVAKFKPGDKEHRFSCRFSALEHGTDSKPVQRGTLTCPDGQVLKFIVGDESGASTPDGAFRVFAGLRSDPFFLAWIVEHTKPFPNLLQHDNVLAIVIEFDTRQVLDPSQGSLFGAIAETVPIPGAAGPIGHEPPRLDWVGRPEQTNMRLNNNGLKGTDDLRDLWNQQPPFRIPEELQPVFRQRLKDSLSNWDMRDGKVDWPPDALDAAVNVYLDDFMLFDVSKPISDTSYLEIEKSTLRGQPYQTGGGRTVNANVIDIMITWMVNNDREFMQGGSTGATQPGRTTFPYQAPPNMQLQTVADVVDLAASPDQVWTVIGQFGGMWHPLIAKAQLTGESVGQLRTIETIDGKQIIERLETMDNSQRLYRYTNVCGIGAVNYTGTLDVKPKGSGSSVEWRVQYLADGQPDFIVKTIVSTLLKVGFEGLKKRFGAEK